MASMRRITETDDAALAQHIVDRLLVEGIEATVRPEGGRGVWVIDDGDLPRAKTWLQTFDGTVDRQATAEAKRRRAAAARDEAGHRQRQQPIQSRWFGGDRAPLGPLSLFLIVGSVVVTLASVLADDGMWAVTIDVWESLRPLDRVRSGEVWRLITPIFLHLGILHILFNLSWVARLGAQIERNHGSWMLLALVIVSGVSSNLGQYVVTGPDFGGMSGVVYALFGFVWMQARFNRAYGYAISVQEVVLGMIWLLLCTTGLMGPIANIGHAGGLIVGLAFGLPAYVHHLRSGTTVDLAEGSWGDVALTGWRRVRRRFFDPYVPAWFLLLAALTIAFERPTLAFLTGGPQQCVQYVERIERCRDHVPPEVEDAFRSYLDAARQTMNHGWGQAELDEANRACAGSYAEMDAWLDSLGCRAEAE